MEVQERVWRVRSEGVKDGRTSTEVRGEGVHLCRLWRLVDDTTGEKVGTESRRDDDGGGRQ